MNDFDIIYEKHKNTVYRLALSYTKNTADAEDIVINTFVKLHKNLSKIKSEEHLRNWLIKVSINECKTLSLSVWKKKVSLFKDNEENRIPESLIQNELLDSIAKLSKTDRLIIHLFYYENYKIEEIAKILNKSTPAIKTKLHRARLKLKEILKEEENDK